jgi:hypothetical protein
MSQHLRPRDTAERSPRRSAIANSVRVGASVSRARKAERAFATCAAAFVLAAAVIAAVRLTMPITRGWWLVAYLALVGGLSQIMLGSGLTSILKGAGARGTSKAATTAQLVLWNVGTVIVAVADLSDAPTGVLAGSVLLLGALALFAFSLRHARTTLRRDRPVPRLTLGYALLLTFLGTSVIVGAALAKALPGQ